MTSSNCHFKIFILQAGPGAPNVWLEAGIHAREWISPATVTYLMNQLITNEEYRDLVRQYDFFILPVTNPDG